MSRWTRGQVAGTLLTVAVVAAVAAGLYVAGSPDDARARRFDERRVGDLSTIVARVDVFWTRQGRLPSSLDDLRQAPGADLPTADPETGRAYEFHLVGGRTFDVCAAFSRPSAPSADPFWTHGTGRHCFRRDARTLR